VLGLLHSISKVWSATCPYLVWLVPEHKIPPDKIDKIVSAEIPDPALDPELHQIMVSNMVHGPCGSINPPPSQPLLPMLQQEPLLPAMMYQPPQQLAAEPLPEITISTNQWPRWVPHPSWLSTS